MDKEIDIETTVRLQDESSFKNVFDQYYSALVRYAYTFLREKDDAEDIVQQVFISLWIKRSELEIHSSLRSFLYRSVQNACLNRIKHLKVKDGAIREMKFTGTTHVNEESITKKELEEKYQKVLGLLPEQCAKIFKMSRFEQLKYQEIADKLGLSVKTVENQMGKALKILREQLKDYLPVLILLFCYH